MPKTLTARTSFDRTLASARTTMVFSEVVQLAIDSFRASKVRFMLTMIGMIIGSASIILVTTLGLTGKQYAIDLISSIGTNMVEMQYSGGSIVGADNTSTPDFMTREDLTAVLDQVPGIIASSPMLEDHHEDISVGGGTTKDTMILGVSPRYTASIRNLRRSSPAASSMIRTLVAPPPKSAVMVEPLAKTCSSAPTACRRRQDHQHPVVFPSPSSASSKMSFDTYGQSEIS